ncbi:uncharacterized protein LOC589637 [Strongylocentrotus purpuratus]|uniref:Fibronectin type-III domain-containing protein n=1 Tax=Strongylocentrotus purpuratus TaxID=7668 RepID=A0A7M7SZU7_STRPU|nr:uncharacterized protein LOC589637 [Strongylocentrotus purpuratus]
MSQMTTMITNYNNNKHHHIFNGKIFLRLVQTARSLKQTEEMCQNYETFGDFTLDLTAALKSFQELDFTKAPGKPVLQPKSSNRYTCLEWTPPTDGGAVASYSVEYIKLDTKQTTDEGIERPTSLPLNNASDDLDESENDEDWTTISGLTECRYEQSNLEMNSSYKIRVKAVNPAGTKSSECILLKTPPAPVLPFKWIQCQSSVAHTSSKVRKDGQEVLVSPTSTLFSSNSSSFPTSPIALEPVHTGRQEADDGETLLGSPS